MKTAKQTLPTDRDETHGHAELVRAWTLGFVAFLTLGAVSLRAQGVEVKRSAIVLCGSPSNCTKPATIHYAEVREATPEWQTIRSEGVRKGSARYTLLMTGMAQRIKAAADLVARDTGHDLVVNKEGIVNERDQTVEDITDQVIAELEPVDPSNGLNTISTYPNSVSRRTT